jgi:nitrogen fixation protein NifU and related proteins
MVDEIVSLNPEDVAQYLGGMPEDKMHCPNLGVGALRYAMADYLHLILDEQPESDTSEA